MASLSTLNFTAIVQNTVAAIQAKATALVNFTVGSVLRAIVEANAGVILWLQGLVSYVLTLTRFATSQGTDADSWAADFSFVRDAAVSATGNVTFTRLTTTTQSVVPFGAVLQTADGTQTFTVNTDPTNAAYSLALGGYVMAPTVATLTVAVTASTPGAGGNVLANTVTSMGQGIPGVDLVTNGAAFINGVNAESDQAFQASFVLFIASLSKGTAAAVASAIAGVQQGLQFTLTENYDYNDTFDPGFFYIVLDDGSGAPASSLLNAVGSAIEAVRALGVRFAVFAPVIVTANVSMTITTATGYNHGTVAANVTTALINFINALGLGNGLPYTQLAAIAYGVPGVTNVSSVLLNSATSDIAGNPQKHDQDLHAVRNGCLVMATGDATDMLTRLKALLPRGWFGDTSPILDALLSGFAYGLSFIYSLIQYAQNQTRIATASDGFLDLIAYDFFGNNLPRQSQETDNAYRTRIRANLFQQRVTRTGMIETLFELTGRTPIIFEPARPADTGAYNVSTSGYGAAGAYGSLALNAQAFITAFRPQTSGIPNVAGYNSSSGGYSTAGYAEYASLDLVTGSATDPEIYAAVAATQAAGTLMWTAIES